MKLTIKKILPVMIFNILKKYKTYLIRIIRQIFEYIGYNISRTSDYYSPLPTESKIKNATIEINTPDKMKFIDFTSNNANITVQFEDETKYIINIISIDSGVEIKKIIIKK